MSIGSAHQALRDIPSPSTSLDPEDWQVQRAQGHRMLDDMFDHLQSLRQQPVWRSPTAIARAAFAVDLPLEPHPLDQVHAQFKDMILPYGSGNAHPGFMGWVQGGGTSVGMLADMVAAGMNTNAGGRDHMPIVVEQQIIRWMRDIYGFPASASGLFVTGASQANFIAILIARTRALGAGVRSQGLPQNTRLTAYTSAEVHGCVPRAMEMAGLGTDYLRKIQVDAYGRIDIAALQQRIAEDKASGLTPFMLIGTAGTVNTGAIDDLKALSSVAADNGLHFHVDGALGALGVLSDELAPLLTGIELCDSLAFDFHKWGQVPYDAGFLLVRNGEWQRQTFASEAAYLTRAETGLAAGDWWPCDYGPDLSRGFRALKTWFTLKTYGLQALGESMAVNCVLARYLAQRIEAETKLILLAPVALNIVCFGHVASDDVAADVLNARIVERLHAAGRVAPSVTLINGKRAIRAAIVNHRTTQVDIDALIDGVLACGAA